MYTVVYIIFYGRNIHFLKFLPPCWHQSVIYIQRSVRKILCEDPFISMKIKLYSRGTPNSWWPLKVECSEICVFIPLLQILIENRGWLLGCSFSSWWRKVPEGRTDLVSLRVRWPWRVLCVPFQKGKAVVKRPSLLTSAPWLKDGVQQLWVYKTLHTEYFPWLL